MVTSSESVEKPAESKFDRFCPSPGQLLFFLLPMEGILLFCNWFQWTPKGWAVLFSLAAVAVTIAVTLLWFILALLFRWRFQFSLRSLLVLTVAVAVPFSWLAVEKKRAKKQRDTIEAIQIRKGNVWLGSLRFGKDMELMIRHTVPREPIWLMNFLGSDFFENVVSVDFTNLPISDGDLEILEGLTQLQHLSLYDTNVTDAGLERLKGLAQLQKLELVNMQVTDAGLEHLEGLTALEYLLLVDTQVTDAGLKHLKGLTKLHCLLLQGTKVTDAGVAELKKALPHVEVYR